MHITADIHIVYTQNSVVILQIQHELCSTVGC